MNKADHLAVLLGNIHRAVHILTIVDHPLHVAVRVSRASERQRFRRVVNLCEMRVQLNSQFVDCGAVFGVEGADCHDYVLYKIVCRKVTILVITQNSHRFRGWSAGP
ncbi:hypothetical protein GWK74_01795 [Candidatus Saccharibacteria bacterium oral taxon 488]|nr:hypothetical protein GWK74_01795 [Candidatus Saccharibacteria bacterium oral taxon 488]